MRRVPEIILWTGISALGLFGAGRSAGQEVFPNSLLTPTKEPELGSLKICLRLPNETAFEGGAQVRVVREQGYELLGGPGEARGEFLFYAVAPGRYLLDVNAPGYLTVQTKMQVGGGGGEKRVIVVMKPKSATVQEAPVVRIEGTPETGAAAAPESAEVKEGWRPREMEESVPAVDRGVACPMKEVLHGVGDRMKEFVSSLEKFTATETLEHYTYDKTGARKGPELRKFAYVVTVTQERWGGFDLEEYRDGTQDRALFPAHIATLGLPTIGLLFHPELAGDFEFECEGLGSWEGRQMWQVHFAQRKDRPVRIEAYEVDGMTYPVYLEGRAWIDPGNFQLAGLESELEKPTQEIKLMEQHQKIRYGGVQFATTGEEIWLPQEAETYVERKGKRFYRRHSFSDFRLFNVDTAQRSQAPKGSYSFTNVTDRDVWCELTVVPADGVKGEPVTLRFNLPAHGRVFKVVGPGKDVNLTVAEVGSARILYSGEEGAVKVDVDLAKETTLDVMSGTAVEKP
jgi:hypothetical protein